MQIYCLKAYIYLKQPLFYHRIFSEIGVKSNYYVVYFIFISCVHACTSLEKNSSSLIIVLFILEYVYIRGEMNSYNFENSYKFCSRDVLCISKWPDILMDMRRHFILGSVYMIFYHSKFHFCQNDRYEIHTRHVFQTHIKRNMQRVCPYLFRFR